MGGYEIGGIGYWNEGYDTNFIYGWCVDWNGL